MNWFSNLFKKKPSDASPSDRRWLEGYRSFEKGKQFYLDRQTNEALQHFDIAIENGYEGDVYDLRAACLQALGYDYDAIEDFNKAISLSPNDCNKYFSRSVSKRSILDFEGELISVIDTKKENNLIIHFTESLPANIQSHVLAKVDLHKRQSTEVHHSATHLLHAALRKVLGTHVAQKGSLVNEEHLRFDFSHFAKLTDEEITQVESMVNEKIRANIRVTIKEMNKEEAIAMGAMALFGEKYSDTVRVVIIDPDYSIELCGGTHVGTTGELGFFKIKHEAAVAAGVRRIEAVSGKAAAQLVTEQFDTIRVIRDTLKSPKELIKSVETLLSDNSELRKRIESLEAKQLIVLKKELVQKAETINGISFVGAIVEVTHADSLKKLCFELKNELTNYVVVLAAAIDGKAQVAVLLDESVSAAKNLEATKIIKEQVAGLIKGGGGGQKTLATAGGQDTSNLQQVIEKVKGLIA